MISALVYRLAYSGDVVRRLADGGCGTEKRFQSSIGFQPVEIHAGCVCYPADGPFERNDVTMICETVH